MSLILAVYTAWVDESNCEVQQSFFLGIQSKKKRHWTVICSKILTQAKNEGYRRQWSNN